MRGQWSKEIKTGTKDLYLSFYKEVVQALEEVTSKDRNGKYFIFSYCVLGIGMAIFLESMGSVLQSACNQ